MYGTEALIIQNLKDAGCNPETIQEFTAKWKKGNTAEEMRLLEQHRRTLLELIHFNQKKIDCLDYLIYQINKEI